DELKRKVNVEIRSKCHDTDDYTTRRAFWPCEILDLKEVQDEIEILTKGELLSEDNPEDREIVRRAIKWLDEEEKQMPLEEVVDNHIGFLNACIGDLGILLARSTEFRRKHPEVKFWFFVEFY
ncbi:MAG: hypothetical protein FGF51_06270, partial [Candidatus Brockarchaeota archaeon]|nr:hypothetical protein [Candidatus Brockarchaeota archaeon]